jgi:hypothetical protein
MNKMFYSMWNGFVRGLYKSNKHEVISNECMGDWMNHNMGHFYNATEVFFTDFKMAPYEEAVKISTELVDVVYKNDEACKFSKVMNDLLSIGDVAMMDDMATAFMQNMFPLMTKVQTLITVLSKETYTESDDQVMEDVDAICDIYGSLIAMITGISLKF